VGRVSRLKLASNQLQEISDREVSIGRAQISVAECGKCDACHDASTRAFWSKRTGRMGYPSMGSNRTATGIEPPEPPPLKLGDRDEDEMADVECSSKKSGETPRASAASLRDAVREAGRFPSDAPRIGAGLSPLPHLRRRADPPLLACLLTRLAMRDRNRDTRPAFAAAGRRRRRGPPLWAPPSALPEACYRRRPAARVRTRSARPQGERVPSCTPNSSPPAHSLGRFLLDAASTGSLAPSPTYQRGYGPLLAVELSAPRSVSQFRQIATVL
jgi:hypothetical protein